MKKEIAIIGISLKVTDAENLEEFWQFIEKNKAGFNPLSVLRQKDLFDRFGAFDIAKMSYLERVDLFDHEFFKISPAEAERMDPEQRLMMECALNAVNNAGYRVKDLKTQRVGIFHTFGQSRYHTFFDDASNLSITAHMPGMVGTRIANFFDWRGPVIGFDTTCSSALSAMYCACDSLHLGDCSMALVGGARLGVTSKKMIGNSPIISKKGHCLPFDQDADGTLGGEGVICVLLKRAEDAIRDGDPIHAIIKGGAVNHGGALIQNISAPSPVAQSEVIRMAWENSKIDPSRIRFIEAHGTGTVLGDPIEFSGLVAAFEGLVESNKTICTVSSIKGQTGHLGPVAGLAGMVRLILALKHKRLLPQAGLAKINAHINEAGAPVSIQKQPEHWESDLPRLGGVSSYGLTGTNVHMVLEEYIAPVEIAPGYGKDIFHVMKVGATTASRATGMKAYLQQYLAVHPEVDLHRLAYSVNKMTEEDPYGQLILFKDHETLNASLNGLSFTAPRKKAKKGQMFLLIPGILGQESMTSFLAIAAAEYDERKITNEHKAFLLHYCAAELMLQAGLSPDKIIGAQSGRLISLLLSEKITMQEALTQLNTGTGNTEPFNRTGFVQFLNSLDTEIDYMFVIMGSRGELSDACMQWGKEKGRENIHIVFPEQEQDACLEILREYYNAGNDLDFTVLFNKALFLHDLHLPLLAPQRHWPVVKPLVAGSIAENEVVIADNGKEQEQLSLDDIIEKVRAIWQEKLKVDVIGTEDDFFDLGGSSLVGLDVLQLIAKRFEVSLEYADIFDYCTVLSQAELIAEKLGEAGAGPTASVNPESKAVVPLTGEEQRSISYEQLVNQIRELPSAPERSPEHILLTGGTGFLGVFIIKELLTATRASITCLVREDTDAMAAERLIYTMREYFPEEQLDYDRINGIKGDITLPDLGLSKEAGKLAGNIDTVYHLAANVSHFGKAELTNKINFEGTVNLLEWSKQAGVRYFNHFSTIAVASGGDIENVENMDFYESDLDLGQDFGRSIYPASKFKAEQYIRQHKGNLQVNVFRMGNIGGDTETGLFQKNIDSNSFYQRLKTLAGLQYYCDEILGYTFTTTPVDMVARMTVRLSLHRNEVLDTFHIIESEPIRFDQVIRQLAKYHITLKRTDVDTFREYFEKLKGDVDASYTTDNTFLGILKYGLMGAPRTQFRINEQATRLYLDKIGADCFYDREQYAHTIIKYCIQKEFIKSIETAL